MLDFITWADMQQMIRLTGSKERDIKSDFRLYCELTNQDPTRESWIEYMSESESFC